MMKNFEECSISVFRFDAIERYFIKNADEVCTYDLDETFELAWDDDRFIACTVYYKDDETVELDCSIATRDNSLTVFFSVTYKNCALIECEPLSIRGIIML